MPDFAQIFEQALAEHGLDAKVIHDEDPTKDSFYVKKDIGNETLQYTTTINMRINTNETEIRKKITAQARAVANQFEEYLTDRFKWNGNVVTVSAYEDGWAQCERCGNKIDLPERGHTIFAKDAELSTPQPFPKDRESLLSDMDDQSRILLKMYLIGRLRRRCGYDCPNQSLNNKDKSQAYKNARFGLDEGDGKVYM